MRRGRGPGLKRKLRNRMLRERGLQRIGYGRLNSPPKLEFPTDGKTLAMRALEQQHGKPIEEIIGEGSLNEVVERLEGILDRSTISKWRKKLGISQ